MSSPFSMLTQGLNRTILFSSIPGYDETFGPKIWKIQWPHFHFFSQNVQIQNFMLFWDGSKRHQFRTTTKMYFVH